MPNNALLAASLLVTGATVARAQAAGHRVDVNGMRMYYEVSGTGEPLIVLHGAYMNIPSMGAIIPSLARTHKVYAIELQGHGRTTDREAVSRGSSIDDHRVRFSMAGQGSRVSPTPHDS